MTEVAEMTEGAEMAERAEMAKVAPREAADSSGKAQNRRVRR